MRNNQLVGVRKRNYNTKTLQVAVDYADLKTFNKYLKQGYTLDNVVGTAAILRKEVAVRGRK